MRIRHFLLLLTLLAAPAAANDVPLGDDAFTGYIQNKIQLYAPAPVRTLAPFTIAIGKPGEANLVFEFAALHADCVAVPADCERKTHDYVQGIVARFAGAGSDTAVGEVVPRDKAGFMEWLAHELRQRRAEARVAVDGMTLVVTRPGGQPIPFDQRGYYQLCEKLQFECASALRLSLDRTAAWLVPARPEGLRISLHACAVDACGASADPMAPVVRASFAGLQEACFKETADAAGPLTNADRADLGLDADAAIALCEKNTRAMLHPLAAPLAGQVTAVSAPYASAHALFAEEWAGFGAPLLVALPSRDAILYIRGDDAAARAALAARAEAAFASAGALALSGKLYRWTGSGFEAL